MSAKDSSEVALQRTIQLRRQASSVRSAVSTKVSDCSSLAGVHTGFNLEPIHIEIEGEDQENEVGNGRDVDECRVEMYQDNVNTMRMTCQL